MSYQDKNERENAIIYIIFKEKYIFYRHMIMSII